MIEISLAPELNHKNANTIVYFKKGEIKTAIGWVRAVATCAVQVGDKYISIEEARELREALVHATMAAVAWRDQISGRSSYVVTREGNRVLCEHMGKKSELRRSRLRKSAHRVPRRCSNCRDEPDVLWVPVHRPWNRMNEVGAELCPSCLEQCTVEPHKKLRVVGDLP